MEISEKISAIGEVVRRQRDAIATVEGGTSIIADDLFQALGPRTTAKLVEKLAFILAIFARENPGQGPESYWREVERFASPNTEGGIRPLPLTADDED